VTLSTTNRCSRIAYLIVLLVFAVALTTALVLAAERTSGTNRSLIDPPPAAGIFAGEAAC
jgi:hypothetical protein